MLLPSARRPPREQRPQSPQLTLRVAALGGLAVILFAVLFFRLWVLQVLSAERYQQAAVQNQLRTVRIPAQRGKILDVRGAVLVDNRPSSAVTFDGSVEQAVARACMRTPTASETRPYTRAELRRALDGLRGKRRVQRRTVLLANPPSRRVWAGCGSGAPGLVALARLTHTRLSKFEDRIHVGLIRDPFEPVTLVDDVSRDLVFYLKEHGADFRGIRVVKRSQRFYPHRFLASHLFGVLGQVNPDDLHNGETYPGVQAGDVVGHSGLERAYDAWLRGRDGTLRVEVDADGYPQGAPAPAPAPIPGRNLRLTIDSGLQAAAQQAIKVGVDVARNDSDPPMLDARKGAVVVMDVHTGAIRALASYPDFDPNTLVGLHGDDTYARLLAMSGEESPLFDRATSAAYPPGSTYKPATAIAAVESGLIGVQQTLLCPASVIVDGQRFRNHEGETSGPIALRDALTISCNTYFYQLGELLYKATDPKGRHQPQPEWARRLGFGEHTGIEIGDSAGVNPDAAFKKRKFDLTGKKPDLIRDRWTSGDAVLGSIGQGYVQVTPLQIAALYALIANGGTLVTPHLGQDIEDGDQNVARKLVYPARARVSLEPSLLATIRAALVGVTHDDAGTAAHAFAGFPVGIAGKTGTAQKYKQDDYSWFAGYGPVDDPQLVVVAVIEQGGKGGDAAARAVRSVFARAFGALRSPNGEVAVPHDIHGATIPPDETQIQNATVWGDPTDPTNPAGAGSAAGGATTTGAGG